jgi:hypothetical protein
LLENWDGLPCFPGPRNVCALISRILLLIAAIDISVWWALGVFLPFGPLFFRLNYPEQARNSYLFRVATLVCIFGFVVMRPGLNFSLRGGRHTTFFAPQTKQPVGYAMEKPVLSKKTNPLSAAPAPSVAQRCAANATELERLHGMEQQLMLRKRDLLHSDTEGNRLYAIDLAAYNEALAKATRGEKCASGGEVILSLEGRALSRPFFWDMTAHVPPLETTHRLPEITSR